MKYAKQCATVAAVYLLLHGAAYAAEINRAQAEELLQQCQAQRQENIAPLRQEAIEDCVTRQRRDRAYCERFNQNYGERSPTGTRMGMFWDLPVCMQATDAQAYFRKNPGRQVYSHD
jgi:hypothetical protein